MRIDKVTIILCAMVVCGISLIVRGEIGPLKYLFRKPKPAKYAYPGRRDMALEIAGAILLVFAFIIGLSSKY